MEELKIVYLPPGDLTPYEKNAKKHASADIEAIKASIKELGGFNDPIGIWGDKNIIVEGHGRQLAALELGLDKVPCIRLDHLTEEQRRAYALAHNKTNELADYDFSVLGEELAVLELDFDMSDFGFDSTIEGNTPPSEDESEPGEGATEYSEEDFGDEQFQCECPRCGFKFNP